MAYLSLASRLLVAAVCLVAAVGKLSGRQAFQAFRQTLAQVGVPSRFVRPAAAGVVAAELAVAALAPWPRTGLAGALLATALLAVLTVGLARAVRRGTAANCRCFGVRGGRLSRVHVMRNATLTAVAITAVIVTATGPPAGAHPAGLALAAAAAALGTVVVIGWEDLAAVVVGGPSRPLSLPEKGHL